MPYTPIYKKALTDPPPTEKELARVKVFIGKFLDSSKKRTGLPAPASGLTLLRLKAGLAWTISYQIPGPWGSMMTLANKLGRPAKIGEWPSMSLEQAISVRNDYFREYADSLAENALGDSAKREEADSAAESPEAPQPHADRSDAPTPLLDTFVGQLEALLPVIRNFPEAAQRSLVMGLADGGRYEH